MAPRKNKKEIAAELKKKRFNEAKGIVDLMLLSKTNIPKDRASTENFSLISTKKALKLVKMPKVKATKKSKNVASTTEKSEAVSSPPNNSIDVVNCNGSETIELHVAEIDAFQPAEMAPVKKKTKKENAAETIYIES